MIATARVPIVVFIVLLGVGLWKRSQRAASIFLLVSIAVTTSLHFGGAYFAHRAGHAYQPMHVLGRAANTGGVSRIEGVLLVCAAGGLVVWQIGPSVLSWLLCIFATMTLVFTPEGIGEYFAVHRWDWEGANYISFPIPLLLAALVLCAPAANPSPDRGFSKVLGNPLPQFTDKER